MPRALCQKESLPVWPIPYRSYPQNYALAVPSSTFTISSPHRCLRILRLLPFRQSSMRERLKRPIPAASIRQIVKHHFGGDTKVVLASMTRGGLFNTIYEIRLGDGRSGVLRIVPPRDKPL